MSSLTEKKNALFGAKSAADGDAAPVSLPATASKTAGISLSSSGVSAEVKKKKTQEGSELAAKAEGLLKTSLFQWTPDYIAAAPMFEAASDCYKQAGEFRTACQLLERAASASEKNNVLSAAAVAMRKASEIAQKELRDKALTAQYLERSAEYWGLSGDLEKNAETLAKAATEVRSQFS